MPVLSDSIDSSVELFVDKHRIARMDGVELRLHTPRPAGVALEFDKPWEGLYAGYVTVLEDEGRYRMYYRGWNGPDNPELVCMAESDDAIEWRRPSLGMFDWKGSKANNIIRSGIGRHNFTPFVDSKPGVPDAERYKAVGRGIDPNKTLFAFVSPDGLQWELLAERPVFTEGAFDSQNLAYWDEEIGRYRLYFRTFGSGIREISVTESDDMLSWDAPRPITLDPPTPEHFYTNAITPYFRNPQYRFGFPKRFFPDRKKLEGHPSDGISEAVMLSSRDGLSFDRVFMESWIRPGLDQRNWGDRSLMTAWGLHQTGPEEMSVWYSEHYRFPTARITRGALRLDGLASAYAGYGGGEVWTKPVRFTGRSLELNYSTGAGGFVQVELRNRFGKPLPGFELEQASELYGDRISERYVWRERDDVSSAAGEPVQLRFVLKDADLYSYRFA